MAGPAWFDSDNFWVQKGATLVAAGGGTVDASLASFRNARIFTTAFSGQMVGAGAILGERTPPPHEHAIGTSPILCIGGYKIQEGNVMQYWGGRGSEANRTFGDPEVGNTTVNFLMRQDDAWQGGRYEPMPPYPEDMEGVDLYIQWYSGTHWPDGGPKWVGQWYFELYSYHNTDTPGYVPEDPPPCPERPKWPYTDPVSAATPNNGVTVRRSRP